MRGARSHAARPVDGRTRRRPRARRPADRAESAYGADSNDRADHADHVTLGDLVDCS
ncbi:hypothetical protein [Streptomyces sp. NPDC046985]|uniref:hypothetical protein n=1 Tax=Streptomyces sp. NPDC046985 TaxID=3155377 RepID=UPI0033D14796